VRIVNPIYKIQNEEKNIFTLRKYDYENILPAVAKILEPVEELGFSVSELDLRDSRFPTGDLTRTIRQSLVIRLKKGQSTIDLSMFIPKLIDGNYVFINGRRKIPLFQMFDVPVITRGNSIKLRTNVATLMVAIEKEPPHVKVSFLGRRVPLSLLMLAYYGMDELVNRFSLNSFDLQKPETILEFLASDLKLYQTESRGYTQDDFILELGRMYSKYNARSKGEDVVYALDLIPRVDVITRKFLKHDVLLDELIDALQIGYVDDTLLTNKRVRCFEYMVLAKVSKNVFDLCFSNRTTRQPKFNINSSQVITESNVSDIVQFDFSINPIEELTKLSRISLLGPGGFRRENIPKHLRDICPTMFGRVCPVDTPDRDNCGVLQNLIPNVHLDENMKFTSKFCEDQPISIPVSMVPFCEHDDQTRLQMSSSQMRQAIMLQKFDKPMIQSGCEGLYTDYTQFVKRAKKDGEVIHIDGKYIMAQYTDGEIDIFDISYRKVYVENVDFMQVYVEMGDKFRAGDILAESNFCKDGSINIGKNLLTAVMSYYGDNYEDAIVISNRLVKERTLMSVHFRDLSFTIPPHKVLMSLNKEKYQPLPKVLEEIKRGNPYAILKTINAEDYYSVFQEENVLRAKSKYIISEVNIYPNEWNTELPEYKDWVEATIENQKEKEHYLCKIIKNKLPTKEAKRFIKENSLDIFSNVGNYKIKKEKINGIHVEMYAIHFRHVQVGDKLANRHGNKGVISRIIPHEKMPLTEDGRHVDICINPLGIISRMNIGQLYELHLSLCLEYLKASLMEKLVTKKPQKEIRDYLLGFIKIVDRTKSGWYHKQFKEQLPDKIGKEFITELNLIQPPFESIHLDDLKKAFEYVSAPYKQKIYDPVSKCHLLNRIAVGYIYFFRMVHIAEEKLAARGIGAYARRTLQPLGGRRNKGGQRCGEMETASLIGHDAPANLLEFLTTKSDCIDKKNQFIRDFINPKLLDEINELDGTPESVKLLDSYLTVLGVDHGKKHE
jgi:DNA-directed RNA polymerase beta subunit